MYSISLYLFLYKIRERKVKTLTKNSRDHHRTGTRKHMETLSKYFDGHGRLSQSEESKCLWTHSRAHRNILIQFPFCVPVLQWSLQFLVRVFTFLSLILWYSYFGTFLSMWSSYIYIYIYIYIYLFIHLIYL